MDANHTGSDVGRDDLSRRAEDIIYKVQDALVRQIVEMMLSLPDREACDVHMVFVHAKLAERDGSAVDKEDILKLLETESVRSVKAFSSLALDGKVQLRPKLTVKVRRLLSKQDPSGPRMAHSTAGRFMSAFIASGHSDRQDWRFLTGCKRPSGRRKALP